MVHGDGANIDKFGQVILEWNLQIVSTGALSLSRE